MPVELGNAFIDGNAISVLVEMHTSHNPAMGGFAGGVSLLQGFNVDRSFAPVPLASQGAARMSFATGSQSSSTMPPTQALRASVASESEFEQLRHAPGVVAVWADPMVSPFPGVDCNSSSTPSSASEVALALGAARVWSDFNVRGGGVTIGIVDGGVDQGLLPPGTVTGGWSPLSNQPYGSSPVAWAGHGNMCAVDALVSCPDAKIHDYGIGRSAGTSTALVSSALRAFQAAIASHQIQQGPDILSNSWGLFQQAWDPFPPGHPSNYTHNLNHPFNRKVIEAIDEGIFVVFAAGNCGEVCPDNRCATDVGAGRSIRGANGLPRVICVGAANVARDWIGYSSQGPSTLDLEKPDICGYSHFQGHTSCDSGTSAACPVVAGVLGLMLEARRIIGLGLGQDEACSVLRNAASNPLAHRWDNRYGRGIVDAYSVVRTVMS